MKTWPLSKARQQFAQIVAATQQEPQILAYRNRPVAALINAQDLQALQQAKTKPKSSLAQSAAVLRQQQQKKSYALTVRKRTTRRSTWPTILDELSD